MHCGMIRRGAAAGQEAELGPIVQAAMQTGRGNYLANLILFPGACGWASCRPPKCPSVGICDPLA